MKSKLLLGCGKLQKEGYHNVDCVNLPGVDEVVDLNKPFPWKDNSFDRIEISHVLEHLDDVPKVIEEIWRVGKNKATVMIEVPFYNCSTAYGDPTHKHFFNFASMNYFTAEAGINYYCKARFKIISKKGIPGPVGKIIPNFSIGKLGFRTKWGLRDLLSHLIPETVRAVRWELEVIK